MDDYLDSFPEPEQALKLSKDLVELLKLGEFKLKKIREQFQRDSERVYVRQATI